MGVPILGTSAENVDRAEDRELFDEVLENAASASVRTHCIYGGRGEKAAHESAIRYSSGPSYVLGGQGMQIAINDEDVDAFIGIINRIAPGTPILVDKYLVGKEIEVDAVCDGEDVLIPGIMEHIERVSIHSGDSIPFIRYRVFLRRSSE